MISNFKGINTLQDPEFTRFGLQPLDYKYKDMAIPYELVINFVKGIAYVMNPEGTKLIPLNDPSLLDHLFDYNNPHRVTKDQIGLGEVLNVEQASYDDLEDHKNDFNNPHRVTKEQVGLGNVLNVEQASKEDMENFKEVYNEYMKELQSLIDKLNELYKPGGGGGGNNDDLHVVTINTVPDNAIVKVFYNNQWNFGKVHMLPDGTYKYEVTDEPSGGNLTLVLDPETSIAKVQYNDNWNEGLEHTLPTFGKYNVELSNPAKIHQLTIKTIPQKDVEVTIEDPFENITWRNELKKTLISGVKYKITGKAVESIAGKYKDKVFEQYGITQDTILTIDLTEGSIALNPDIEIDINNIHYPKIKVSKRINGNYVLAIGGINSVDRKKGFVSIYEADSSLMFKFKSKSEIIGSNDLAYEFNEFSLSKNGDYLLSYRNSNENITDKTSFVIYNTNNMNEIYRFVLTDNKNISGLPNDIYEVEEMNNCLAHFVGDNIVVAYFHIIYSGDTNSSIYAIKFKKTGNTFSPIVAKKVNFDGTIRFIDKFAELKINSDGNIVIFSLSTSIVYVIILNNEGDIINTSTNMDNKYINSNINEICENRLMFLKEPINQNSIYIYNYYIYEVINNNLQYKKNVNIRVENLSTSNHNLITKNLFISNTNNCDLYDIDKNKRVETHDNNDIYKIVKEFYKYDIFNYRYIKIIDNLVFVCFYEKILLFKIKDPEIKNLFNNGIFKKS